MIGEIRWSLVPYYDSRAHRMKFKRRPILVIAKADVNDYVAIPVSRITAKHNLNQVYDIPIDPSVYPNAGLTSISYVRTHKQIVVNEGEIANPISDLKAAYPDLYLSILEKREQFSAEITEQALG